MTVIVAAMGWSWQEAEVDPLTGAVSADPHDRGPARADFAALEHALRLAQTWDAQVVAATVGPADADTMLRDALAAGAAEALRVEPAGRAPALRPADLVGGRQDLPAALAAALRERYGVPYLVLCGDRSADRGTGSFPAFLAAALNAAQALGVVRMEPDGDRVLRVHRRLDGGRREVLRVRRPRRRVRRSGRGAAAAGRAARHAGQPGRGHSGGPHGGEPRRTGSRSWAPTRTGPGRASSPARPARRCTGPWS